MKSRTKVARWCDSPAVAKTPAQRGRIGNWLRESRLQRGYSSAAEAREAIERLTGWRIQPSVFAEWESGRRLPSDENLEKLRSFFGDEPDAPRAVGDVAEIVAAIDRQTEAIRELVRELSATRASQDARDTAVQEALADLANSLAARDTQSVDDPASRGTPVR